MSNTIRPYDFATRSYDRHPINEGPPSHQHPQLSPEHDHSDAAIGVNIVDVYGRQAQRENHVYTENMVRQSMMENIPPLHELNGKSYRLYNKLKSVPGREWRIRDLRGSQISEPEIQNLVEEINALLQAVPSNWRIQLRPSNVGSTSGGRLGTVVQLINFRATQM